MTSRPPSSTNFEEFRFGTMCQGNLTSKWEIKELVWDKYVLCCVNLETFFKWVELKNKKSNSGVLFYSVNFCADYRHSKKNDIIP